MKQRKHVLFVLVMMMVAVVALSVNTVLAGDFDKTAPQSPHPPVCVKSQSYVPGGPALLECLDSGHDIVNVSVKSNSKYELNWNESEVRLQLLATNDDTFAYYVIRDKAGAVVSGRLP